MADKTGEVYTFPYPLDTLLLQQKYASIEELPPISDKDPLTKPNDERFMGRFLLGHSCSIVDMTMGQAPYARFLVTCDRDEHIRFSVYPETYVIQTMGLGHTAFVSTICTIDDGVISGGGEGRLLSMGWDGNIRGEYSISQGSCIRHIRRWKDVVFVVGEKFHCSKKFAHCRSSTVEVVRLDGLTCIQKIEVGAAVLDIAIQENKLFISVDANEGNWIVEYRCNGSEWEEMHSDRWHISRREEADIVDLYYLETMRKRIGSLEDE